MLISELQAQLETIKQEHGDVSVVIREFAGLPNFGIFKSFVSLPLWTKTVCLYR